MIVYKVVKKDILGRYVSAAMLSKTFKTEYFLNKKSYPPTKFSTAWLIAFKTLEDAKHFSGYGFIIFRASATKTKQCNIICHLLTTEGILRFWKEGDYKNPCLVGSYVPPGSIFCSDITLLKEII